MTWLALLAMGTLAWSVSTLAAGGGAILFLPVARWALPPEAIPPVIAVASVVSSVQRIGLYRRDIDRRIFAANVPGLVAGSLLGALALGSLSARWLGAVVGVFLLVLAALHFSGRSVKLPEARPIHFGLASFGTAVLSALVGAAGPTMNPVYLASGVVKERMIGTKAASTLLMQVAKLGSFAALGLMTVEVWQAGALVGIGALAGNWVGKHLLARITADRFSSYAYAALGVAGAGIVWREFG